MALKIGYAYMVRNKQEIILSAGGLRRRVHPALSQPQGPWLMAHVDCYSGILWVKFRACCGVVH